MAEQPQSRYVQMPNGSYVEWPEGVSAADFKAKTASLGGAPAAPADNRNSVQKSFDTNTQDNPNEGMLQTGLKHVVGAVGAPFVHPLNTLKGLVPSMSPSMQDIQSANDMTGKSVSHELAGAAGDVLGSGLVGGAAGEMGGALLGKAGGAIREAALGDPNAAALRGLQVGPKSPNALKTVSAVETARPYLKGAENLKDLQARVPAAKAEIWQEYQKAIDSMGDTPVMGPDGVTTIRALEDERLQLSALNRGLKAQNPEAIQLAKQKEMTQAQLLDREKLVKAHLDPQLEKVGIDPTATRRAFGSVAQIGSRISGKSTLIEPTQETSLGKIANLSLEKPLQAPGKILSGLKDIAAGRPLFSAKPTDLGIREGFANAGAKPSLGSFRPPLIKGLLPSPLEDIPLHDPFQEGPSGYVGQTTPNYKWGDPVPTVEGATGINQQGILRKRK